MDTTFYRGRRLRMNSRLRSLTEEVTVLAKDLIQPIRVAVSGRAVSPPLFETLAILGKDATLRRLDHALGLAG